MSDPNPYLKRLGLRDTARVLVIHADDVGLTHSSLEAFTDLAADGAVDSGSIHGPSPWLPSVAARAAEHPEWDLGLHLVLHSEFAGFRWRPVGSVIPATGLVDGSGWMRQDRMQVARRADPQSVGAETRAQLRHVRGLGLEPTHVDTHAGLAWDAKFVERFGALADEEQVLPVLQRTDIAALRDEIDQLPNDKQKMMYWGLLKDSLAADPLVRDFEQRGLPTVDIVSMTPPNTVWRPDERADWIRELVDGLPEGTITHLVLHPVTDTAETRGALGRAAESRLADLAVLQDPELREWLAGSGVERMGYRELLARGRAPVGPHVAPEAESETETDAGSRADVGSDTD